MCLDAELHGYVWALGPEAKLPRWICATRDSLITRRISCSATLIQADYGAEEMDSGIGATP